MTGRTLTESFSPDIPELLIDLELPEDQERPEAGWPVIVWLHGGGWRLQDRTARPEFHRYFTPRGFVMASIDYRLAPENVHPAQVADLRQALRWLRVNAERLGINPDRIGLWGSSAGGHIAAFAALSSHVDALPQERVPAEYSGVSAAVNSVVEGYGPALIADLLPGTDRPTEMPHTPEEDLVGGPVSAPEEYDELLARARLASPALIDSPSPPPFFILHGTGDTMVPASQSEALHQHVTDLGGDSLLYLIEGFGHGFLNPGDVMELGPGVRLDNGRLEREPDTPFTASESAGEDNFNPRGRPASIDLIGDFFEHHLQN
jgi:acetyl esterase/lipase